VLARVLSAVAAGPASPVAAPTPPQRPTGIENGRFESVSALYYYDISNQLDAGANATYMAVRSQRFEDLACVSNMFGLETLKRWICNNVFATLSPQCTGGLLRGVPPVDRVLFQSMEGTGVRGFIDAFCRETHVNLVVITHLFHETGLLRETLHQALEHRPCVVLFDRCTPWFDTDQNYVRTGLEWVNQHQCKVQQELDQRRRAHAAKGLLGMPISTNLAYEALPNFWTVFSHSSRASLSPTFLRQFASTGGAIAIAPPTPLDTYSFITLYVKQLLLRFGLARSDAELKVSIGQLRELIDGYAEVFRGDVPGFIVATVEQCLRSMREVVAERATGSARSAPLFAEAAPVLEFFPSDKAVSTEKQRTEIMAQNAAQEHHHQQQQQHHHHRAHQHQQLAQFHQPAPPPQPLLVQQQPATVHSRSSIEAAHRQRQQMPQPKAPSTLQQHRHAVSGGGSSLAPTTSDAYQQDEPRYYAEDAHNRM
jgi:hypothetical protein